MSTSREGFYGSLREMLKLSQDPLLTDTFPPTNPHNVGARILRHGLAVSAFSVLEKYIELTFAELMLDVAKSGVNYHHFPERLKRFLTIDAVVGLANRVSFTDGADQQTYVDQQIRLVASYGAIPPIYTALGFSPRGSNVSDDDILKAFGACGVARPWEKLAKIATDIGAHRISLSADYRNLAKARHRSAHNPDGNVPTSDLQSNIETAIVIGIAVDVLAVGAGRAFRHSAKPVDLEKALDSLSHRFRFLDEQPDGTYLERRTDTGRAIKRYPDEPTARSAATARAPAGAIIYRDTRRVPMALL